MNAKTQWFVNGLLLEEEYYTHIKRDAENAL